MKVAIHQPHYFPWIGYFDKMAKADAFILLDNVQLEKSSQMLRNKVLSKEGKEKYITIPGEKDDFLKRKYKDILTKDIEEWTNRQYRTLKDYYFTASYRDETLDWLEEFFTNRYRTICEWTCASIELISRFLEIHTKIIMQSNLDVDNKVQKSDLVLELCKQVGADTYISGKGGSVKYLNREAFQKQKIKLEFQEFIHPIYEQKNSAEFISGISILDLFFNVGIENAKNIFWNNVEGRKSGDAI